MVPLMLARPPCLVLAPDSPRFPSLPPLERHASSYRPGFLAWKPSLLLRDRPLDREVGGLPPFTLDALITSSPSSVTSGAFSQTLIPPGPSLYLLVSQTFSCIVVTELNVKSPPSSAPSER